jgi:hypothetical protein
MGGGRPNGTHVWVRRCFGRARLAGALSARRALRCAVCQELNWFCGLLTVRST